MHVLMIVACLVAADFVSADYMVSKKRLTRPDAEAFCKSHDGHLISITTESVFEGVIDWLFSEGGNQKHTFWTAASLKPDENNRVVCADGVTDCFVKWSPKASLKLSDPVVRASKTLISFQMSKTVGGRDQIALRNQYPHVKNRALCVVPPPSKCTPRSTFDMMIVLDESGSIQYDRYQLLKVFLNQIIAKFQDSIDSGLVDVGLISFSKTPRTQIPMQSYSSADLTAKISGVTYSKGGTYINRAINYANPQFLAASSREKKVMLVITDGKSSDTPKSAPDAARAQGITPLAVGVSGYNVGDLMNIAGNDSNLVFEIPEFDQLAQYVRSISDIICS